MKRGDAVNVTLPGRFNPNLPGNREPDQIVRGTFQARHQGIPPSVSVILDGHDLASCVAADNVKAAR